MNHRHDIYGMHTQTILYGVLKQDRINHCGVDDGFVINKATIRQNRLDHYE